MDLSKFFNAQRGGLAGDSLPIDLTKLELRELPMPHANPTGNPRRILEPPRHRPKASFVYQGDLVLVVYESWSYKVELVDYGYDEFVHVLEGKLILTATGKKPVEIGAGGHVMVPQGFSGIWETEGEPFRELVTMEYESWRTAEFPDSSDSQ